MKVSVVTAATLLAFIGLKSNTYMSVFVHLFSILFIKERHIVLWDVWPAMCVCVGVLDFLRSLPNLSGGQLSFLCAVEVCRTPQWKWYWWLLFFPLFFPFQKNKNKKKNPTRCAELRIVLPVVILLWLLAKAVFSAWNISLHD